MPYRITASRIGLLAAAAWLAGCASSPTLHYTVPAQPEGASGYTEKPGWATTQFAVAAANPLATDAGYQVLKAGGSAVDAAIAVQMVLTLVEPQSSGIGGGAFLLHSDGQAIEAYDGRETAPATADEKLFLDANGKPMAFHDGVVGGRSVGVPGTLRMLEMAHRAHGKMPWATLFQPAIVLAEKGFKVSPRLHTLLSNEKYLPKDPVAAAYFYDASGKPWPVGHVLKNPELAAVLRNIAAQGSTALYEGPLAQAIVDKVRKHPSNPGQLSLADLAGYQAKKREALCHDYRAREHDYRLCGFPPPSSGAIAIGQILGILNQTQAATLPLDQGLPSHQWLHLYTEASRLAFADRALYVADADFVPVPVAGLVAPDYLAQRAALIGERSLGIAQPGQPAGIQVAYAPDRSPLRISTSQVVAVDDQGGAVSMTTTVESAFGSHLMVQGFVLNNQMTDFSFIPEENGQPVANRVQPGKRPRSAMAPTLVFDRQSGELLAALGSPGGSQIIEYVSKSLVAMLDWQLDPQAAINLPNFGSRNGATELETGLFSPALKQALRDKGHALSEIEMTSGVQAIVRTRDAQGKVLLSGGADPRREGEALGD